jgi:PKD repeat protein
MRLGLLAGILALAACSTTHAADLGGAGQNSAKTSKVATRALNKELQLVGLAIYSVQGTSVILKQDEVRNNRFSGTSGSLFLQMWEFPQRFDPTVSNNGYMIGQAPLGTLGAGMSFFNVNQTVPYTAPTEDGTFFPVLLLVETSMAGTFFYDYIEFGGNDVYVNGQGTTVSPPTLTALTSATAKQGAPFAFTFNGVGGIPIDFTATGLPKGLTLINSTLSATSEGQPTISGIPGEEGTFNVTLTATNDDGSDQKTLTLDVRSKKENAPPTILAMNVDDFSGVTGRRYTFTARAYDPENSLLTYAWTFGDGSTGAGSTVFHTYSAAGNYTIGLDVSDGTSTVSSSFTFNVTGPQVLDPFIDSVASSSNPSLINTVVTFTANGVSPAGQTLTYQWNFGDGTAVVTGNPVTHTYTATGEYRVTAGALDQSGRIGIFGNFVQFVADSNDPSLNITTGTTTTSPDGVVITVSPAPVGVLALNLDVTGGSVERRASVDFNTSFLVPSRVATASVPGRNPTQKIDREGVVVATATGQDPSSPTNVMRGQKTIPVGATDLGQDPDAPDTLTDAQKVMSATKLAGKFDFVQDKTDQVKLTCELMIPAGYDLTRSHELSVGLANVADRIVLDAKGKPTGLSDRGVLSKVKIKYPRSKTGATTSASIARLDITLAAPNLDEAGFGSDGVTPDNPGNIKLQLAVVLAGLPYTGEVPATFKVSSKGDKGQMKIQK